MADDPHAPPIGEALIEARLAALEFALASQTLALNLMAAALAREDAEAFAARRLDAVLATAPADPWTRELIVRLLAPRRAPEA